MKFDDVETQWGLIFDSQREDLSLQWNFNSQVWASSGVLFPRPVTIERTNYFWKPTILFANSFELTAFRCSTQFTIIFVFWKMSVDNAKLLALGGGPCFWRRCALEKKDWKNFELFVMQTSLGPVSQKLFGQKWRNLNSLLFFFKKLWVANWIDFFQSVGHVSGWSFLLLHFYWNVCNWTSKMSGY